MASLLDVLFHQLPQKKTYTDKQPLEALNSTPSRQGMSDEEYLALLNAYLSGVSPAAGNLKKPDRPDGLFNLYNMLKDGTIYRNSW